MLIIVMIMHAVLMARCFCFVWREGSCAWDIVGLWRQLSSLNSCVESETCSLVVNNESFGWRSFKFDKVVRYPNGKRHWYSSAEGKEEFVDIQNPKKKIKNWSHIFNSELHILLSILINAVQPANPLPRELTSLMFSHRKRSPKSGLQHRLRRKCNPFLYNE